MRALIFAFALSMLGGCVSTHMKQFMNKDIREVMIDAGPPINAFDMGNGVRAFQFRWGGGSFAFPQTTNTTGNVTSYSNTAWLSAQSITTGGGTYHSEGCLITYLATWSAERNTWVVTSIRYPKGLVC